jgi:hypothetical protein
MRQVFGDKIRLKVVDPERAGLLSRLRRSPGASGLSKSGLAFADDLVSAVETRTLWSRYGI